MRRTILSVLISLFLRGVIEASPSNFYFNILDYGAKPDGKTLSTEAIQKVVDACEKAGGGKVVVPPGKYLTGPIFLKSNVHVEILAGAVLLAHQNIENYPTVDGRWEGIERKVYASLFTGHDLENVSITGRGILDGQGEVWWKAHRKTEGMRNKAGIQGREPENPPGSPLKWPRPRVINLYRCTNVLIRDLIVLDSPSWSIHPVYCENVTIENITIIQPYESPNTDGINPESSKNVRIFNCFVDCGDDCITIKSGYNEDGRRINIPCENIVIANCIFAHGRSAIGIGSETSGGVRNVAISNCVFKDTYRGLRIKSARGRGNVVESIRATNIVMENVGTGISLDMFYGEHDETPKPVDETTPYFRNIRYSHISGTNLKKGGEIWGLPEAPMEGVTLIDVKLAAETGLEVKFTKDIDVHDVEINVQKGPALSISTSTGVELDNVTTKKPIKDTPVIMVENVKDGVLRDSKAVDGTDIFLEKKGKENDVEMVNNRLSKAARPILNSPSVKSDLDTDQEIYLSYSQLPKPVQAMLQKKSANTQLAILSKTVKIDKLYMK